MLTNSGFIMQNLCRPEEFERGGEPLTQNSLHFTKSKNISLYSNHVSTKMFLTCTELLIIYPIYLNDKLFINCTILHLISNYILITLKSDTMNLL